MKKFAAGLFAATVVFFGMTALAEETNQDVYVGSDNSVHIADYNGVNGTEYTTVLIRKAETTGADGVVYVDQQSDGLDSVMNFMLKAGVEKDKYTATFGNSAGDTQTINFEVGGITVDSGKVTLDHANKMTVVGEPEKQEDLEGTKDDGLYKKGFAFTAKPEDFNRFNCIYLVKQDGTGYGTIELYDSGANQWPTYSGTGEIAFGIQIYNIPENYKGMNLYLGEASAQ